MPGAREENRGGEVSVGVRYPLLMPCTLPQALTDINGGKGKSVMSYAPDSSALVKARPKVNLAVWCK